MKYIELTIYSSKDGEELVANTLFECGADGVLIENREEIIKIAREKENFDYFAEEFLDTLSSVVLLKMFIDENTFLAIYPQIKNELAILLENTKGIIDVGSLETTTCEIDDVDYLNVWKQHYKPIVFDKITVCPKWLKSDKGEDRTVYLDPGTAFGTGSHETTSVVLELLEEENVAEKVVCDIGTGSGILGIAAAKLGAKWVYMCDIDEEAVRVAHENAVFNGVDSLCKIEVSNLAGGVDFVPDVTLANITADILIAVASEIDRVVGTGGVLILSGILNEKLAEVQEKYLSFGFKIKKSVSKKEWSGLTLTK